MAAITEKTFNELLSEHISKADVQIKVTSGEKIHGTITEVGRDYVILTLGSQRQLINIQNIILVSPGLL